MPSTWIFQSNPDVLDIDGWLATAPDEIYWRVRQNSKHIAVVTRSTSGARKGGRKREAEFSQAKATLGPKRAAMQARRRRYQIDGKRS